MTVDQYRDASKASTAVCDFVQHLGRLVRDDSDPDLARRLAGKISDASEVLDVGLYHGVVGQLHAAAVSSSPDGSRILEQLLELSGKVIEELETAHAAVVQDIAACVADDPFLDVRVLKGLAVRDLYPSGSPRLVSDADLLLRSDREAWHFVRRLAGLGYYVEYVRYFTASTAQPEVFAKMQLKHRAEPRRMIELHVGGFPSVADVPLETELWNGDGEVAVEGRLRPVSPSASILVLCAHLLRHGVVVLKDVNDLDVLTQQPGLIDWEFVLAGAKRHGLRGPLLGLLAHGRLTRETTAVRARLASEVRAWEKLLAHALTTGLRRDVDLIFTRRQTVVIGIGQLAFLGHVYRRRLGLQRATRELLPWLQLVTAYAAPFDSPTTARDWRRRHVRILPDHQSLVAVPILPRDGTPWEFQGLATEAVRAAADRARVPLRPLGTGALAWDAGAEDELILTENGILAQSSFGGLIPGGMRTALDERALQLVERLKHTGALFR